MSTELSRITELAKEDKHRQFTSIAHFLTVEALYAAFLNLRKEASAGVDGVRHEEYAGNVRENLGKLHERMKRGQYRAMPLRRIYIPKEDGSGR
jgi:RNA-directed DNA polymerase